MKKRKPKLYKIKGTARTNGCGLWSTERRTVVLRGLTVSHIDSELDYMCFEAFFTIKSWDINKHGLIYTDKKWLNEFKNLMVLELGISPQCANDIDYTEQGMQGDNYVSLCVGRKSKKELLVKFIEEGLVSFNINNYKS